MGYGFLTYIGVVALPAPGESGRLDPATLPIGEFAGRRPAMEEAKQAAHRLPEAQHWTHVAVAMQRSADGVRVVGWYSPLGFGELSDELTPRDPFAELLSRGARGTLTAEIAARINADLRLLEAAQPPGAEREEVRRHAGRIIAVVAEQVRSRAETTVGALAAGYESRGRRHSAPPFARCHEF